jgi:hypothetical protein
VSTGACPPTAATQQANAATWARVSVADAPSPPAIVNGRRRAWVSTSRSPRHTALAPRWTTLTRLPSTTTTATRATAIPAPIAMPIGLGAETLSAPNAARDPTTTTVIISCAVCAVPTTASASAAPRPERLR